MLDGGAAHFCDAGFFKQSRFQQGQENNTPRLLRCAVEGQPVVAGLDMHKRTDAAALFPSQDRSAENYTCPAGGAALVAQFTALGLPDRACGLRDRPGWIRLGAGRDGRRVQADDLCRARIAAIRGHPDRQTGKLSGACAATQADCEKLG